MIISGLEVEINVLPILQIDDKIKISLNDDQFEQLLAAAAARKDNLPAELAELLGKLTSKEDILAVKKLIKKLLKRNVRKKIYYPFGTLLERRRLNKKGFDITRTHCSLEPSDYSIYNFTSSDFDDSDIFLALVAENQNPEKTFLVVDIDTMNRLLGTAVIPSRVFKSLDDVISYLPTPEG